MAVNMKMNLLTFRSPQHTSCCQGQSSTEVREIFTIGRELLAFLSVNELKMPHVVLNKS